jgi:predicted RNA-binding Zn-ribbon protein involved in translation (DUF1610 family)
MNEQGSRSGEVVQQSEWSGKPCPHCGSSDIVSGLEFNQGVEVGPFGLTYRTAAVFKGTEKLHAELCCSCGTILRIYVNNAKRNWLVRGKQDKDIE